MDDTDNPFLPPESDETTSDAADFDWDDDVDPRKVGKARHVPTIAILLIVHGVLMYVAAGGLIAMIFFMVPQMQQQFERQVEMQRQQNPNAPQVGAETMTTLVTAVYGAMSAGLAIIGTLNIFAGIRNYGYRNRTLGIVSLVLNVGSIFFCWCLPLSIGLLIYGLIIYLSPEADRAFRWRSNSSSGTAAA